MKRFVVILILWILLLLMFGCEKMNQDARDTDYVQAHGYKDTLTVYINPTDVVVTVTPPTHLHPYYSYTIFNGTCYTTRSISTIDPPRTTNREILLIKHK